jgi:poly(3-hydroxyalkanoate) synthetase
LQPLSGKKVPAKAAGAVNSVLENAPGSFVKDRFDRR